MPSFRFTSQEPGQSSFRVAPLTRWSDTIRGHKKTSHRVSMEAVRNALLETRREASAVALPLPSAVQLETLTFPSTTALQRKLSFGASDFSPLRHAPLSQNENIIPKTTHGGAVNYWQNIARSESAAMKWQGRIRDS